MIYFIQADVTTKVKGISGPFIDRNVTKLVNANSTDEAKHKFENALRARVAHMHPEDIQFNYLIIGDEIK